MVLASVASCGRLRFDASTTDGDAGLDGPLGEAAPDGLPLAPPCGTQVLVSDDFTGTSPDPLFACTMDPGMTCSEGGGLASVVFTPPIAVYQFALYVTTSAYPVDGLCVTAEIAALPGDEGAVFYKIEGMRELEFVIGRTVVQMRTQTNNVVDEGSMTQRTPDPSWTVWRLRAQGTNGFWEVSSDGVTFYELREEPGLFASSPTAKLVIGAGTIVDSNVADVASFESLRATGP